MAYKKLCLILLLLAILSRFFIDVASAQLSYPLDEVAPVTSSFDEFRRITRGAHAGLDLDTVGGERVRAAKIGEAYFYEYDPSEGGYGLYLILKHNDGFYTLYAHLATISQEILDADLIKNGKFNDPGETPPVIDQSYLTGGTKALGTGSGGQRSHLHFEIMRGLAVKEAAVNPLTNGLYQPDTVAPAYAHGPRDFTLVGPGPDNTLGTADDADLTGQQEDSILWGIIRLVVGAYDYFQQRPRFDTNIYSIKCAAQNIADSNKRWQSEAYSFDTYLTQDKLGDIYNLTSPRISTGDHNRFYYYRTWQTTDYPDGRYRLASQIDDLNQITTWPERSTFIRTLDNYAPYVKNVIITQGDRVIYNFLAGINKIALAGGGYLEFKIIFSESMRTEGKGGKTGGSAVTFGLSYPYNAYSVHPTGGWSTTYLYNDTWTGTAPAPTTNGSYQLSISAEDTAGNQLDSEPSTLAQRTGIDSWTGYSPGSDRKHSFRVKTVPDPEKLTQIVLEYSENPQYYATLWNVLAGSFYQTYSVIDERGVSGGSSIIQGFGRSIIKVKAYNAVEEPVGDLILSVKANEKGTDTGSGTVPSTVTLDVNGEGQFEYIPGDEATGNEGTYEMPVPEVLYNTITVYYGELDDPEVVKSSIEVNYRSPTKYSKKPNSSSPMLLRTKWKIWSDGMEPTGDEVEINPTWSDTTIDILANTDNPNEVKSRSDDLIFTAYEASQAKTVLVTFANGDTGIARWGSHDHLHFLFVWDDSSGHHNQWIYSPSLE